MDIISMEEHATFTSAVRKLFENTGFTLFEANFVSQRDLICRSNTNPAIIFGVIIVPDTQTLPFTRQIEKIQQWSAGKGVPNLQIISRCVFNPSITAFAKHHPEIQLIDRNEFLETYAEVLPDEQLPILQAPVKTSKHHSATGSGPLLSNLKKINLLKMSPFKNKQSKQEDKKVST